MTSTGPAQDEPELLERVRGGDADAFGVLVDRYSDQAFAVAYGYLRHPQDAEDLVQDAFIRALEKLDTLRPGSAFGPWFYRVLVNTALNRRRYLVRRRTDPLPENADGGADPAHATDRAELRRRLAGALSELPEDLETVVILHDLEGFTHPEIARVLGIPEGTCRSHLFRARRMLRRSLQEYERQLP